MTEQEVLQAIIDAFHPQATDPHLEVAGERVFGSVTVIGSTTFDSLDDIRRQRLLWDQLRSSLGARALSVGPIVLEPTNRG